MDKSTAEKTLEGSLLRKLDDPRYFIMFGAFALYWDSYLNLTDRPGLLKLTYVVGNAIPIGDILVLIGSFSLLASILSPAIFWIANYIFWELWFAIPDKLRPGEDGSVWARRFSASVSRQDLKLWAIKSNSSIAMSLVTEKERSDDELEKNRPQPFLLVVSTCLNYFFVENGLLKTAERALPSESQEYFLAGLLAFLALLLYMAFTGASNDMGRIYLPGLKEHINDEKG
jgi:hypothetical protein